MGSSSRMPLCWLIRIECPNCGYTETATFGPIRGWEIWICPNCDRRYRVMEELILESLDEEEGGR